MRVRPSFFRRETFTNLRLLSVFVDPRLLTIASRKRQDDHYYLFADMKNTFRRDMLMVARDYQLHRFPEATELLKDMLTYMDYGDRLTFVLENTELIKNTQDALEVFDLIFPEEQLEHDQGERLMLVNAVKHLFQHKHDRMSFEARLHARDWQHLPSFEEEKLSMRHT